MPASQRPSTSLAPRRIKVCSSSSSSIPQPVEEQARKTQLKKVRVICTDPDATESSSDEQDVVCTTGKKRVVREVLIPAALLSWPEEVAGNNATVLTNGRDNELSHTSASSAFSFSRKSISSRCSSKRSSKKWRLRHVTKREQQAGSANEYSEQRNGGAGRYIGVRQRRWGKWTAELREPSQGVRMWLGTFDSAKEAAIAYDEAVRQVKGAEAVTNFCTAAAASDATFGDSCWPLYSSTEELLCCSELHGMEDCLLAYSPSSVLDLPTSLDGGSPSPSPSPSSLLDPAYSDDCGSPLQQLDQALADVEAQADMGASAYQEFGMVLGEECNMQLESAASTAEPLYESFGKLGDYGEACHMGHEDVFLCHEFASCGGFSEDETANLMSFELDAEALTWIDIQP